ncbi:putative eukaryotic translation initiation factor eIF1a-like protein, partial [Choiromyces venosus 120613-1]
RPPPSTLSSLDTLTTTPPPTLSQTQSIARVLANTGKHIYRVESPDGRELLVELAKMYRSVVWVRRNRFVLVDTEGYEGKGGKVAGEIKVVVRGEKGWMGMGYWPKHFTIGYEGEDEMYEGQEESVVGKMPPGSDDDE